MSTNKTKTRVLIAEDEAPLRNLIELSLKADNYEVIHAVDGRDALAKFESDGEFNIIILDVMMPYLDGYSVLQEIRKTSEVPVVMLTALGAGDDVIRGFKSGADDYITKPFTFRELSARIEAILRRVSWTKEAAPEPNVQRSGEITLEIDSHRLLIANELCHITPIEFNLLKYFMSHAEQVIGKEELFHNVWGYEFEGSTNLVEVGVRRLREKIEKKPSEPRYIHTVRGIGYKFHYSGDE